MYNVYGLGNIYFVLNNFNGPKHAYLNHFQFWVLRMFIENIWAYVMIWTNKYDLFRYYVLWFYVRTEQHTYVYIWYVILVPHAGVLHIPKLNMWPLTYTLTLPIICLRMGYVYKCIAHMYCICIARICYINSLVFFCQRIFVGKEKYGIQQIHCALKFGVSRLNLFEGKTSFHAVGNNNKLMKQTKNEWSCSRICVK